jgi:hypothetical protein
MQNILIIIIIKSSFLNRLVLFPTKNEFDSKFPRIGNNYVIMIMRFSCRFLQFEVWQKHRIAPQVISIEIPDESKLLKWRKNV